MRSIRKGLVSRIHAIAREMEQLGLSEYVSLLANRRRLFWVNFWGGLARGFGIAVGFSILGAVVVVLVQHLALENMPVIGEFLAEVVRMVQQKLR